MLCLCASVFSLTSCTKADIHYLAESPANGYVVIEPAYKDLLPAHTYYFYRSDTVLPHIELNCDGQGNFRGALPAGSYRVIATNPLAEGVEFSNMDSHATALVKASGLNGILSTRSELPYSGIDRVFSTVLEELIVIGGDTVRRIPVPVLLTRAVSLTFTLKGRLPDYLIGITGSFQGIYPSVHLFNQNTSSDEISKSPHLSMSFTAHASADPTIWQARLHLFGVCNPRYGEAYENILSLTLDLGGEQQHISVNISNVLSDLIAENDNELPLELPLEIELEWDGIEVTATVKPWQSGGTGEGEM